MRVTSPSLCSSASSRWPSAADGSRSSSGSTTNGRRCSSCCSLAWAQALLAAWRHGRPRPSCRLIVEAHGLGQRLTSRCKCLLRRGRSCPSSARPPSTVLPRPSSSERSCSSRRSKRRLPNGVRRAARSRPCLPGRRCTRRGPGGAQVRVLAEVPWQSMHWISMPARTSCCSLVLPCTSWTKWQSMQCMPFSRWMSSRWTGTPVHGLTLVRCLRLEVASLHEARRCRRAE